MLWGMLGLIGLIMAGLIGGGLWLMMLLSSRKTGENPPTRSGTESKLPLPDLIPNHSILTESYPARPNTVSFPLTPLQASIPLGFGLFAAGSSLLFGCLTTTTMTLPAWQTYYLLKDTGVTTEAVVIKRIFNQDSRTETRYMITYQYTAPRPQGAVQQFTKATPVRLSTYESLSEGAHIPILYAVPDPAVSRPQSEFEPPVWSLAWAGLPLLLGLAGLGVALWGGWELKQVWALEDRGQMIIGVIFDRWVADPYRRPPCVAYYFDLPGQPNERSRVIRAEYNRTAYNTYQVGDSVQIRYLPDNPKICRLEL